MSLNERSIPQQHILVIDDSEDQLLLMRLLLESETYKVTTVDNAQDGIKQINHSPPDLIVLDLMMPCMSGLEVINCLKASPYLSQIPILLLTANNNFHKSDAKKASAVCHKPFDLESLLSLVHSLLPVMKIKYRALTC